MSKKRIFGRMSFFLYSFSDMEEKYTVIRGPPCNLRIYINRTKIRGEKL